MGKIERRNNVGKENDMKRYSYVDDVPDEDSKAILSTINSFIESLDFKSLEQKGGGMRGVPEYMGSLVLGRFGTNRNGQSTDAGYVAALYRVDPFWADRVRKEIFKIDDPGK
jgi:hypothetical protein